MRITSTIKASIAALLGAAVLAGPAGAIPADSHPWFPGESTIAGSTKTLTGSRSDEQGANGAPQAKVYVPPASLAPNAVAPAATSGLTTHRQSTPASASSSVFDWGDAAIGAGAAIGALMIALAAAVALRHRRRVRAA
jgi:hypothetical protein